MRLASLIVLLAVALPLQTVSAEDNFQSAIQELISAGGGDLTIPAGVHILEHGLKLKNAKNVRLVGAGGGPSVLKLGPVTYAYASTRVEPGAVRIPVTRQRGMTAGMQLHIEAPGAIESFTKKPRPFHVAIVKAVEADAILLDAPLEYPIPDGTMLRDNHAPNLIEILGDSENIRIENLTLDGGRTTDDPPVRGHVYLCGISAFGAYGYESGPNGPQIRNLTVTNCIVQNCHGRGISMYASENAIIHHCTIRDVTDEAINLDHFTERALVTNNHILHCPVGIELNDVTDCVIAGNDLHECGLGIKLWRWCKQEHLNEGNLVVRNLVDRTTGNAIEIAAGTRQNIIMFNQISNSGRNGIFVAGEGQVIQGNQVTACAGKDLLVGGTGHVIHPSGDH